MARTPNTFPPKTSKLLTVRRLEVDLPRIGRLSKELRNVPGRRTFYISRPGNPGPLNPMTTQHDLGRVLATESFQKFLHFARTWSGPFQFQASKLLTVRKI